MSVTNLTIALAIAYLIIIKIVAYLAHKNSVETLEDYFIAGRKTGVFALVATLVATNVNTLAFTTFPAFVYEGGILASQVLVGIPFSFFLLLYFAPKIWRYSEQHNFITQAEIFGSYYQSPLLYFLTVIIGIISVFPFLIVQFAAVAKVFSTATNNVVNYEMSVLLLALFTGVYVFFGGAKAVIWTDAVQGLFFLILIAITASLFIIWAGGFSQGVETLTEVIPEKLVFNKENTASFLDLIFAWSFAFFLWPPVFQRFMMGSSKAVMVRAIWWKLAVVIFVKINLIIIGIMATAVLYGQINDSDKLVAEMYARYFPMGGAIVVLAILACGMSTIDSILLSVASIFTRDILEKLLPNPLPEASQYLMAQIISVVTLVVVSALALSEVGRGYLAPLVTFGATFATFLFWPLLGMFGWKASTKAGVLSAMFLGFAAFCLSDPICNYFGLSIPFSSTSVAFLVSLVSFISISLLTRSPVKLLDEAG